MFNVVENIYPSGGSKVGVGFAFFVMLFKDWWVVEIIGRRVGNVENRVASQVFELKPGI